MGESLLETNSLAGVQGVARKHRNRITYAYLVEFPAAEETTLKLERLSDGLSVVVLPLLPDWAL